MLRSFPAEHGPAPPGLRPGRKGELPGAQGSRSPLQPPGSDSMPEHGLPFLRGGAAVALIAAPGP